MCLSLDALVKSALDPTPSPRCAPELPKTSGTHPACSYTMAPSDEASTSHIRHLYRHR